MTPSLRKTPVPGVWGTEAMGRTLRTLRWSSSMRRARPVATDRRHTFGVAATGRAMLSNQNNAVSVCNRVTMPLTSPGVESEARAMTKRKRRLDSGMVVLKLDSWTSLGEQRTEHSHSAAAKRCSLAGLRPGSVGWGWVGRYSPRVFPGLTARARREGAPCKGAHTAERALSERGLTNPRGLINSRILPSTTSSARDPRACARGQWRAGCRESPG